MYRIRITRPITHMHTPMATRTPSLWDQDLDSGLASIGGRSSAIDMCSWAARSPRSSGADSEAAHLWATAGSSVVADLCHTVADLPVVADLCHTVADLPVAADLCRAVADLPVAASEEAEAFTEEAEAFTAAVEGKICVLRL
jgi:hypothetical protein